MTEEGILLRIGANFSELEKALDKLPHDADRAAREISAAFKAVGLRDLEGEFRNAQAAFDILERSGVASAKQLADAADNVKAKWAAWKEPIEEVDNRLQRFAATAASVGAALTASITVPFTALGKVAFDAAEALDGAYDKIRVGTGETGAALGNLQNSFKAVFRDVPDSAQQVSLALSEVHKRTGEVGPGLEALSRQFLDLSRITGESMGPAIAKTTRLFGDWSIEASKQASSMDLLFKVSQQTGISFTSLADKLVVAGAPLRQLGMSFEQSAIMLGKFEKEGVNVELVLGAMRAALAKFGKAGLEPVEAFKELVAAIKNADVAQGNLIAAQVVGTKRMADFAAAVREGRLDLEGLFKSVLGSKETIAQAAGDVADYGEAWGKLKNQLTLALEPLGAILFDALGKAAKSMQWAIDLVTQLAASFASLPEGVQTAAVVFAGLMAVLGPVTVAVAGMAAAWPLVVTGMAAVGVSAAALTTSMSLLGAAALAAAGAFAIYAAGQAWTEMAKAGREAYKASQDLEASTAKLEATAKKMGISVDRTGKTLEQYTAELNKAVRANPEYQAQLSRNAEAAARTAAEFAKLPPQVRMLAESYQSMADKLRAAGKLDEALKVEKTIEDLKRTGAQTRTTGIDFENFGKHGDAAAKKVAAAAKALAAEIETGWNKISTTLHNLPKSFSEFEQAISKGFNATGSLKQLDEQIWKLEQGFGTKIPEAIRKGMIVHLDLARKAVFDFKTQADQIQLDKAFTSATAAVLAFTTNVKNAGKEGLAYLSSIGLGTKAITDQATAAAGAWLQLDKDLKTLSVTTGTNLAKAAKDATSAYNGLVLAAEAGLISSIDLQKGLVTALQAQVAAAKAAGEPWKGLDEQLKTAQKTLAGMTGTVKESGSEMQKAWQGFGNQISTIFTDLGKGVANAILHAKGLGDAFTQAANAIKEAFLRMVVEGAINSVMKSLKGLEVDFTNFGASIAKMFKGVFEGISSALGGIGKALGSLFGTGTETVSKTVGGAGGGVPGVGGGAMGGVTGAVGGITGVVGAIGSIGTMISSIVGNFQMAGMNKTLDLLEKGIRYSEAHLLHILENSNKYWPLLNNTIELMRLEAIERYAAESNEYLRAMASGGNLGEMFGSAIGQLATALQSSQAQITVNLTQATRTMGEGMRGAMQQMITDMHTVGQTSVNWLKLISEGVWATYSAVAKAGAPQTTAPGERATYVPGRTTTPVNAPGNVINVNLQTQSTNPYQQAVLIAQNLNNLLPSRS